MQVICPSVSHQSERLEPAQALSLDVDKGTLGAALDFYTKGELLEGDNQYYCEAVGAKVTLPPSMLARDIYRVKGTN